MKRNKLYIALVTIFSSLINISAVNAQEVININADIKKQTIDGFGGSIAYYENWLTAHSKRASIYDHLFKDLGISILRLRNSYMNESGTNQGIVDLGLIVKEAKKRGPIDILISSWSPPGVYKSNGKPANDGTMATLATDTAGNFVYDDFASWWYESLLQYKTRGIDANYISIQNEPNWNADWEACIFMPQEQMVTDTKLDSTYKVASYATAFRKVYDFLDLNKSNLNILPKMIGPEVLGIENAWSGRPSDYTKYMDMTKCYAVAHHLYTGGNNSNPSTFITNFSQLAKNYPDKPKMQTEYSEGDWYATALLIHYSLVYEGVSAYLVWDLVWPGSGIIDIMNPWTPGTWTNTNGFTAGTKYYALKQYSAFVKPGWIRIDASNASSTVKTTAFISPDGFKATVVMINTSLSGKDVMPEPLLFNVTGGNIYRTSATENCILVGSYSPGNITLPPKSITTLALEGNVFPAAINSIIRSTGSLLVYPNPVSDQSVIKISGYSDHAEVTITNVFGQVVNRRIVGNEESLSIGRNLYPGIYIIHISDGVKQESVRIEKL